MKKSQVRPDITTSFFLLSDFFILKKKSENRVYHLEVALLAVVFHHEAIRVSNPDSRVQLWLVQ